MKKFFNKKMIFIFVLFLGLLFINNNLVFASVSITTASTNWIDTSVSNNETVLITSSTYNTAYIDSYLDLEQSPFDAFKLIIDYYNEQYPDVLNYTSSDLPEYYALFTAPDDDEECGYSYFFLFSSKSFKRDTNLYAGQFSCSFVSSDSDESEEGLIVYASCNEGRLYCKS